MLCQIPLYHSYKRLEKQTQSRRQGTSIREAFEFLGGGHKSHCACHTVGLIYETNVQPKNGYAVVCTRNLEFINMDVSGGYDQISRQAWARVRTFLS